LYNYIEDLPFRGRGQPPRLQLRNESVTFPPLVTSLPARPACNGSPAGIHGATRKIVFDGTRELLMSL